MKIMKFIGSLLLAILLSVGVSYSEGLLPGLDEVYGVEVPSFTDVIKKFPDAVQETEMGKSLTYYDVSDEHYYAFGDALKAAGCEVKDYSVNNTTVIVIISYKGREFTFSYDNAGNTMTVLVPDGIIENPKMTPTPIPTPTPTPTPTPVPTPLPTATPKRVSEGKDVGYYIDLGNKNEYMLYINQNEQLHATIESLDNVDHSKINVVWETSNNSVVTVNRNGQITGISAGDAVITCRSKADSEVYSLVFIHVKPVLPGDNITFGHYEQDNNSVNGLEEIEWIVLDVQEGKCLLLSRYGLDTMPYYNKWFSGKTWESSDLRKWLNNQFIKTAFTKKEQSAILTTMVDNTVDQAYSGWVTSGEKNTKDRIFLLSYAEANRYLGVTFDDVNNFKARVAPTAYAISQGAWTSSSQLSVDGEPTGWWWLRSPGIYDYDTAHVSGDGSLYYMDNHISNGIVRPAFWLNLKSDIF